MATRIYIASDLHAAEKAWRKFINAISLNVYKADVALMAGDLTGKAILPLVRRDDGALHAELFGVNRVGAHVRRGHAIGARHRGRRLLLV